MTLARVALFSLPLLWMQTQQSLAVCPPTCGIAYTVDSTGDGGNMAATNTICDDGTGHCTLRAAIQAANSHPGNDGIFFNIPTAGNNCDASGNCTINLGTTLQNLSDPVTITGPGADKLTVRRSSSSLFRIFTVTTTSGVSISGLTIANGSVAGDGGGIENLNAGTVNVTDCTLSGNSASRGDGIFNNSTGTVNVTTSLLTSNSQANSSGGGIFNNSTGTVNVTTSTLSNNFAAGGGGIDNSSTGTVNVTNSTLSGNSANVVGAGIYNSQGTVTISNSTLFGNSATATPASGQSAYGGGIYNSLGTVTISNSTLSGNSATGATSSASMAGDGIGGAIINASAGSTLNVTNCTLSGNSATGGSGFGSNTIGGLAVGGAISNGGTLNITNSTLSGNSAAGGSGLGGNNSPGGQARGGAIWSNTSSFTNCTLSGNSATGGSGSGTNPKVGSGSGGGIYGNIGSVTVKSTIIANNTASPNSSPSPDVFGSFSSQGFNLIGKNDGAAASFPAGNPNANNDIVGTVASLMDPKLDPSGLKNNGGPTQTIALLFGSPAIDKGIANSLTTDQRGPGFPRTFNDPNVPKASGGDETDIGAFEVQTAAPGLVANVSTRLPVGTGDNVLIEGFTVQGPAGSTKKIIVRAIGPFLATCCGITDALANPTLEIHDASKANAIVAMNDDWKVTQFGSLITADQSAEIAASGFAPNNDLESAIIANLPPGSYTAVVRGVGNSVGTGVVDAYDLSAASSAKLVNVATRGLIQPGDQLMVAGFIIQNGAVRAVVKAIGPSLAAFGITNALADTTLQIRTPNGAIVVENDDWKVRTNGTSQQAELEATGLQPTNDLEAAVLTTLPPGAYTAQVRGKPESTGIGVVQVYFLQ